MSLLLSDGRNVGGFSAQEADLFLRPLDDTGLKYHFSSLGQLAADYQHGLFGEAFHYAQVLHLFQILAGTPPQGK